jgi:hypothetical protein
MTENRQKLGHSADIRMQLSVNGSVLPIAQLGPGFLILKEPIDHPPSDGEIAVWIDGSERRWRIHLEHGIRASILKTPITKCQCDN